MPDYVEKGQKTYLADQRGVPLQLGAPVCLGSTAVTVDTSSTGNDLASLLAAGTPPLTLATLITSGLSFILVTVETNNVRISFDDSDPTTNGLLYAKDNARPYAFDPSDFTKMRMVAQTASAALKIACFI